MKTPEELAEDHAFNIFAERYESLVSEDKHVYAEAVNAFLAGYQAAAPKWISVQDRWPKDGEAVLITEGINVGICKAVVVQFKGHARLGWEKRFDTGETSHWMPLPQPPKEEA